MAFSKSFFNFIKPVAKPFIIVGSVLYRLVILNIYRLIVSLVNFVNKSLGPIKNKFLVPFINRYVSHLLIILLTTTVVFLNYQIKEVKTQQFGEQSILFAIAHGSDLTDELTTETGDQKQRSSVSYLDIFGSTSGNTQNQDDSQFNNQAIITESGGVFGTPIASLETLKAPRYKVANYLVANGDTVSEIADRFDLRVTTILWANNLTANSFLRPGQSLVIPPTDGVLYTFKKGDSLNSIVKKFSGDVDTILKFNALASANEISTGQTIMIPGGKPYYAPPPIQTTKIAKVTDIFNKVANPNVSLSGFIWPTVTRRLSQYFSWRHTGLDIDGDFGDPIWAANDGVVIRVQYLKYDYGYHVVIDHGNGINTLYAHFQKIYVTPGQTVTKGQALGEMGSTGRSTGSHLHFEYRLRGARLNPLNYVSRK